MKRENIKINSKCDNLTLDIEIFIPNNDIKGIVQLAHGMVEHKEYYYDFMKYLTNNGYVTIINDHRGHGKSIKDKEDLGYLYDETSNYLVDDIHQITMLVKEKYPNKKIALFGHSMGSLIIRKYLKKYDDDIDKLIICGSPSKNKFSKMGLRISKLTKLFKGDRYRSNFLNKMILTKDKTNSWLSNNEEYVKTYNDDELCGYTFTTNGFINLMNLMNEVYNKKGWQLKNKELKIFYIAGADDIIIKSKKKWQKSGKYLNKIGYTNVKGKLYPNMKHAIINENKNYKVYKDILKFLKEK